MRDFIEIMNFCGYDLARADAMAKGYADPAEGALTDAGLEALQPEPMRPECRGLCGEGCQRCAKPDMV